MKKIAVVTGGGSGIGQAAALELQKSGFNIFIVGRREEELMKTVKLSEVSDYKIIPFPADITNSNDVKSKKYLSELHLKKSKQNFYASTKSFQHVL